MSALSLDTIVAEELARVRLAPEALPVERSRRTVFAPDLPGFGNEPAPAGFDYSVDSYADWVAAYGRERRGAGERQPAPGEIPLAQPSVQRGAVESDFALL